MGASRCTRRRLGLLTVLALCVLSGVPCGAVDQRMRMIRSGKFRIAQAQDRADGLRSRLLQRFGLDRLHQFNVAAGVAGAQIELPVPLRLGTPETWELRLQPAVGADLRRQQQRRFAGTARMRATLKGNVWPEGAVRPGLQLSMRAGLSGKDVVFAAGRGTYQGNLTLTKHLGPWTLESNAGLRSKQVVHGWRQEPTRSTADASLSAAWQRDARMEALFAVSAGRTRAASTYTRVAVALGGGLAIHEQAFASLLLRYRSDGRMYLQPGLTISL